MFHLTVLLCFFLSGATGLIYENIWVKELGLVFGSTIHASTLVLGTFMGGLALGSWLLGPRGSRHPRPLKVYGWLEMFIAMACLVFPEALAMVRRIYFETVVPSGLPAWTHFPFQFLAIGGLLLIPTALMGATLPVLCEHVSRGNDQPGRVLGILYFANTAGAVGGSLVAGFWLIPNLGLSHALFAAVVVNVLAGLIALVAEVVGPQLAGATVKDEARDEDSPVLVPRGSVMVFIFINGFFAMAYQIALMKFLPLIFGSSVHSFALMVSAFIAGISVGSLLSERILSRGGHAGTWMGTSQILGGGLFLTSTWMCDLLPLVYVGLRRSLHVDFWLFQSVLFALVFFYLSIPALFLGMALPMACEAGGRRSGLGTWVSKLYAVNTLGNILGTVIAGFLMIPGLGFQKTLIVASAFNVVLGLAMLRFPLGPMRLTGVAIPVLATLGVAVAGMTRLDPAFINGEFFRKGRVADDIPLSEVRNSLSSAHEILFWHEDASSIVSVERHRTAGDLSLKVNGKVDASTGWDMSTQAMLAHLPLLAHPDPKSCLIIGLGSGVTHAAGLAHPIESMESVEISPGVVVASTFFREHNHNPLADPRMKLHLDDGRNFLYKNAGKTWDIIISEPSNPWFAGISNLFTVEFFAETRRHLPPGGVMCQWVQGYEMSRSTFELIMRTFGGVFKYVEVFRTVGADFILLGSGHPLEFDPDRIVGRLIRPELAASLAAIGIDSPLKLAAHHMVSWREFHYLAGLGTVNTDDRGVLEYVAPRELYESHQVEIPQDYYRSESPNYLFRTYVERLGATPEQLLGVVRSMQREWSPAMILTTLEEILAEAPDLAPAHLALGSVLAANGRNVEAVDHLTRATALDPGNTAMLEALRDATFKMEMQADSFRHPHDHDRSLELASRLVASEPGRAIHYAWKCLGLVRMGRFEEVIRTAEEYDRNASKNDSGEIQPQVDVLRAVALIHFNRLQEARAIIEGLPALPGDMLPEIARRAIADLHVREARQSSIAP